MREVTIKQIKQDIETAAYVDKLLPKVKAKGYVSFMMMFPIKYTQQEITFMDKKPIRLRATQEQIEIWEKVVLEWMFVLEPKERILVWKRANRIPWKIICIYFGKDRTSVWRLYTQILSKIQGFEKQKMLQQKSLQHFH